MKNIIFDLGRVLIDFQPEKFLENEFGAKKAEILYRAIFGSSKWSKFDLGEISQHDLIENIVKDSPVERFDVEKIFYLLPTLLRPIEDNCKLLEKLSSKYHLYILSNFPKEPFISVSKFSFFKYFRGEIISYEVGMKKPDSRIFELLINKYQLDVNETLFIDDSLLNVEAACRLGIIGCYLDEPHHLYDLLERRSMIE